MQFYIFGGMFWKGLSNLNEMLCLNLDTFFWERVDYYSNLVIRPANTMSCVAYDRKIYVYGGYNGYNDSNFWVFDPSMFLTKQVYYIKQLDK
jgi:hypothetical protein